MTLTAPTNEQLNEAFAEEVAGWKRHRTIGLVMDAWRDENDVFRMRTEPWCESADAVMPWLEKRKHWQCGKSVVDGKHWVNLGGYEDSVADTIPRACVIALLRAHGVEITL